MKKALKLLLNLVTGFIGLAAALFLVGHFGLPSPFRAYVVQSGSMAPAVKLGSVVFSRAAPAYLSGDIITFAPNGDEQRLTTHRIVFKTYPDGIYAEPVYLTGGDANEEFDRWQVRNEHILGKVVFSIPYLGYLVDFAQKPQGFILLVIIPATIVVYEELRTLRQELRKLLSALLARLRRRTQPKATINLLPAQPEDGLPRMAVAVPLAGATLAFIAVTGAYFLDNELSLGNFLGAATEFSTPTPSPTPTPSVSPSPSPTPTPTPGVQPGNVVINEIMWMGTQGDAADEWIELRNMTDSVIDISLWVVDNLGSGVTNDIVIPAGKTIPANGFFLIANDSEATGNHSVAPDHQTNISLLNPGEQLRLRTSAGGTIIDTADNDGGGWFAGVDPGGQNPERSMERNDVPGDGTVSTNWHSATAAVNMDVGERELATPKTANSPP